jgi:predicted Zn-dependent protease
MFDTFYEITFMIKTKIIANPPPLEDYTFDYLMDTAKSRNTDGRFLEAEVLLLAALENAPPKMIVRTKIQLGYLYFNLGDQAAAKKNTLDAYIYYQKTSNLLRGGIRHKAESKRDLAKANWTYSLIDISLKNGDYQEALGLLESVFPTRRNKHHQELLQQVKKGLEHKTETEKQVNPPGTKVVEQAPQDTFQEEVDFALQLSDEGEVSTAYEYLLGLYQDVDPVKKKENILALAVAAGDIELYAINQNLSLESEKDLIKLEKLLQKGNEINLLSELAMIHRYFGRDRIALKMLRTLDKRSDDPFTSFQLLQTLIDQRFFTEAEPLIRPLSTNITNWPDDIRSMAWKAIGDVALIMGDRPLAFHAFNESIIANQNNPSAYLELADLHLKDEGLADVTKATKILQGLLKEGHEQASIFYLLGEAELITQGQHSEDSTKLFQKSLDMILPSESPSISEQMILAKIYNRLHSYKESHTIFEKVIPQLRSEFKSNKISSIFFGDALGDYIFTLKENGKVAEAADIAEEMIQINPQDGSIQLYYGSLLNELGRSNDIIKFFYPTRIDDMMDRRSDYQQSDILTVNILVSTALIKSGQYANAHSILLRVHQHFPEELRIIEQLAVTYQKKPKTSEGEQKKSLLKSKEFLEFLVSKNFYDHRSLLSILYIHKKLDIKRGALKWVEKIKESSGVDLELAATAAYFYNEHKQHAEAIQLFEFLKDTNTYFSEGKEPTSLHAELLFESGIAYSMTNQLIDASVNITKAFFTYGELSRTSNFGLTIKTITNLTKKATIVASKLIKSEPEHAGHLLDAILKFHPKATLAKKLRKKLPAAPEVKQFTPPPDFLKRSFL